MISAKHNRVDLLNGPIFPAMLRFALTLLFSHVFQQLYNTMDTVIVGHTLGSQALASIGAGTAIYDLLVGFALGIGNGLSVVTARSFGRGDPNELRRTVASSIVIGLCITALITLLSRFILYPLLHKLNTPAQIIDSTASYLSVLTGCCGVMFAYNLCAGLLRAIGNSVVPLLFLIFSSLLNIVLDFVFILFLHMGITGAAAATVLAQCVSVVLCVLYISMRCPLLVPRLSDYKPDPLLYQELITQGLSMGFMNCIVSAGTVVLQGSINALGQLVIAGHTAARKLNALCTIPLLAMAQTLNVFVSQNRGANHRDRIRSAMRYGALFGILVSLILTVLLQFAAAPLVRAISGSSNAELIHNASLYLRINAPFYTALSLLINTRHALQAIGQRFLPLISSFIELSGKILFAALLVPHWGYMAIIFCEPFVWCLMAIQLSISFYSDPFIRSGIR